MIYNTITTKENTKTKSHTAGGRKMNKKARNYLRFGEYGNYIENDITKRKVIRVSRGIDTMPNCHLLENEKIIKFYADFSEACDFIGI